MRSTTPLLGICLLLASPLVHADPAGTKATEGARQDTKASPTTSTATTVTATAATDEDTDKETEAASPFSASLAIGTSVGLGTFAPSNQRQASVGTSVTPTVNFQVSDDVRLSAAIGLSFYHLNDAGTSLPDGEILLSDLYMTVSGPIFADEDLGFSLSGAFRVYAPTSKASQFQNRLFSMRPTLSASQKAGPVTFSWTLGMAKYFNTSTSASLDCEDFVDGQCKTGRGPEVGGGFASEVQGGEVFLPSSGLSSFYVMNSLSVGWSIVDGLSLSLGATVYNIFGVRAFDDDEFASINAKPGRSQTDRLITSVSLSYQIIKQLTAGISLSTDTVRPFGAAGGDLVAFDFSRAPDNITSLGFSLTGSL